MDCMGFGFKQCDDEESSECVGGADKNYVYRVVEEGKFYLNIYLYFEVVFRMKLQGCS